MYNGMRKGNDISENIKQPDTCDVKITGDNLQGAKYESLPIVKFEELKNIRDFSELTIDEYATASIGDISQMLLAEAIRGSRKVVIDQGTSELLTLKCSDEKMAKLLRLLTAFINATDYEFIEHYLYALPTDRDAWVDEKCTAFRNQHIRKKEKGHE